MTGASEEEELIRRLRAGGQAALAELFAGQRDGGHYPVIR